MVTEVIQCFLRCAVATVGSPETNGLFPCATRGEKGDGLATATRATEFQATRLFFDALHILLGSEHVESLAPWIYICSLTAPDPSFSNTIATHILLVSDQRVPKVRSDLRVSELSKVWANSEIDALSRISEFAGDVVEEGEYHIECSGALVLMLGDCPHTRPAGCV